MALTKDQQRAVCSGRALMGENVGGSGHNVRVPEMNNGVTVRMPQRDSVLSAELQIVRTESVYNQGGPQSWHAYAHFVVVAIDVGTRIDYVYHRSCGRQVVRRSGPSLETPSTT